MRLRRGRAGIAHHMRREFATDSLLEESGFEPPVPLLRNAGLKNYGVNPFQGSNSSSREAG
jgi:hypothetical protein